MKSSVSIALFLLLSGLFLSTLLGAIERNRKLLAVAVACLAAVVCIIVFLTPVQLPPSWRLGSSDDRDVSTTSSTAGPAGVSTTSSTTVPAEGSTASSTPGSTVGSATGSTVPSVVTPPVSSNVTSTVTTEAIGAQ